MKDEKVLAGTLNGWNKQSLDGEVCVVWGYLDKDLCGRFPDESFIHTSATPNISMKEGDVIETTNTRYTLGTAGVWGDV